MNKLIIDIGNTNTKFGIFNKNDLLSKFVVPTEQVDLNWLKKIFRNNNIYFVFVGSVVKGMETKLKLLIKKHFNLPTRIIASHDFINVFDLANFNVSEIGVDILAMAFYIKASHRKGVGISFGTATFAVAVNYDSFHGVLIAPSIELGTLQLNKTTSLIKEKNHLISNQGSLVFGKSTKTSLINGAVHTAYGFVASVQRFAETTHKLQDVYVTGGKTSYLEILKTLKKVKIVDDATLIGYHEISKIINI